MATSPDDTILEPDMDQKEQEAEDEIVEADTPKPKTSTSSRITTSTTKAGDPARRTLTTGAPKRPTSTATAATTKPASVAVRSSAGSSISKPPTRPPVTLASARRPPVSSTTLPDRSRASIGLSGTSSKDGSTTDEPKRTMAAGTARRASLVSSLASRTEPVPSPAPTVRRTVPTTSADRKPSTLNNGTTPMAKRSALTTPRPVRSSTITSNSSRPGTALEGRKRLSTIPASPAVQGSPTAAKTPRPVLAKRQSTMSTNLQQKLREMELVHQMLRVAMAQDGDQDDELKAEYSQQMGQKITELRSQLEQSGSAISLAPEPSADKGDAQLSENQTTSHSDDTDARIVGLEAELVDLRKQLATQQAKQTAHSPTATVSGTQSEIEEKISKLNAEHSAELGRLKDEAEAKEHALQKEKLESQGYHDAEIAKFRQALSATAALYQQQLAQSTKDFEAQKLEAVRQAQQESDQAIETQRSAHETETSNLQQTIKQKEDQHLSTAAELEDVSKRLATVQEQLVVSEKQAAENASSEAKHVESIVDKEKELSQLSILLETAEAEYRTASNRISELETELTASKAAQELATKLQDDMTAKDSEIANLREQGNASTQQSGTRIQELEETATAQTRDIESLQAKIKDLETAASNVDAQQKETTDSKAEQLLTLQGKVKQLEADKAALDDQKHSLTTEKDAEIATLHSKITDADKAFSARSMELIAAKDAELQQLETRLADLDTKNQADLAERTESYATKDLEMTKLQTKVTELETAAKEVESERQSTKTTLEEELAQIKGQLETEKQAAQDAKDEAAKLADETHSRHSQEAKGFAETNTRVTEERDNLKTRVEAISAQAAEADNLRKQVNELSQALETTKALLETSQVQSQKEHTSHLDELQKQHESVLSTKEADHHSSLSRLEEEVTNLSQERDARSEALDSLQQQLADTEAKLSEADKQAAEFQEQDKSKFQQALSRVDELQKALREKTEELEATASTQANVLANVREEHDASTRELQSHHNGELDSLRTAQATQIQKLEAKHSSDQSEWQRAQKDTSVQLLAQSEQSTESVRKSLEESHDTTLHELTSKHTAELDGLRQQLSLAEQNLTNVQSVLEEMRKDASDWNTTKADHASEMAKHETLHHELKIRTAELSGQLNTAQNNNNVQKQAHQAEMAGLSEKLDSLRATHDAATTAYEGQIAKLEADQEARLKDLQIQHETVAEEHEKQRKAGAQVRDKLVVQLEELEGAHQSLPVLEEKVAKLQSKFESSKEQISQLRVELDNAQAVATEERIHNDNLKEELAALHRKLEENSNAPQQQDNSIAIAESQSLKASLQDEQAQNTTLRKQLADTTITVRYHAARVQEAEAALKVASMEIAALKTRIRGPATPTLAGLSSSRWASDETAEPQPTEYTDESAEAQGALASIHAQLQSLREINDSLMNSHSHIFVDGENGSANPASPQATLSPSSASTRSLSGAAPEFVSGRL